MFNVQAGESSVTLAIGGNAYRVDLLRKTQTNTQSNFSRKIRRDTLPLPWQLKQPDVEQINELRRHAP